MSCAIGTSGEKIGGRWSLELRRTTFGSVAALAIPIAFSWALLSFAQSTKPPLAARGQSGTSSTDLSGVWLEKQNLITFSPKEPPFQSWAEAKYKAAKPGYGPHATPDSQDPILQCYPPGVPRIMLIPFPMQIVQLPGQVMMVFEYDHFVRFIELERRNASGGRITILWWTI